jgi:5-methyltetrahydrofolate--homocysteine methyltransferase
MLSTAALPDRSATELEALAAKRVLVKAGPSGTALLRLGLGEREFRGERFANARLPLAGNFDVLVLTQPALVERMHHEYLEAGADLIETNTFSAQALSQRRFGLEGAVFELNVAAAQLARRAAERFSARDPERPRFVLGNMGPSEVRSTRGGAGDEGEGDWAPVRAAYAEQARALIEGGVHALLLETVYDEGTARACVAGILEGCGAVGRSLPLLLSFSPGDDGRSMSGRDLTQLLSEFEHQAAPWAFGTNCGFGPESATQSLEALAAAAPCLVSVYPNAGLPDASGRYPAGDEVLTRVGGCAARGLVNIVGGCCGTTPHLVSELVGAVAGLEPRPFRRREAGRDWGMIPRL